MTRSCNATSIYAVGWSTYVRTYCMYTRMYVHTYVPQLLFAGHLVSHVKKGPEILHLVRAFPFVSLAASIQPITRTVLKVLLTITPDFEWQDRLHGSTSEPWWVWVEDADNNLMYHSEYFLLQKKQVRMYVCACMRACACMCVRVHVCACVGRKVGR